MSDPKRFPEPVDMIVKLTPASVPDESIDEFQKRFHDALDKAIQAEDDQ